MTCRSILSLVIAAALCCAVFANAAQADPLAEAARDVLGANKEAVVTVKLVVENRFSRQGSGSQSEESKAEITGTVIDATGLVVVSLFTTDPTSASSKMMGIDFEQMGFRMETEVKSADILTADGDEIPAEIVLRDKDLDLAFLRPKEKPEQALTPLDLSKAATPQQLDPIVAVSRLGRVANRVHGALIDRVEAVVEKPRTFYVPSGAGMTNGSLGAPVFTLEGDVVGILVLRAIRSSGGGGMMGMFGGGGGDNATMIVLPAGDVLEVAGQAPEHAQPKAEEAPAQGEEAPAESAQQ